MLRAGDYQQVLKVVGKSGDYKANVLKVNIPRNDLHVAIAGYLVPTPFGFGGWFADQRRRRGCHDGNLVLLGKLIGYVKLLDHGWKSLPCTITSSGHSRRVLCTRSRHGRPWI